MNGIMDDALTLRRLMHLWLTGLRAVGVMVESNQFVYILQNQENAASKKDSWAVMEHH